MTFSCVEDTFISIIQLYLAIPLIIQYKTYTDQAHSTLETAETYLVMGLSIASVASSILSIANVLTKSIFELVIHPYYGTLKSARATLFVAMVLQVTSRLLTLQLFGLTFFEDTLLTPLWLASLLGGHIILVACVNLILERRIMMERAHRFLERLGLDLIYTEHTTCQRQKLV